MPAVTILIADKHDHFRRSVRQLCEINGGFQVVAEATTTAEVVTMAWQLRPNAVLMDMHLPDLDGVETTRLLLADHPDLVVILLAFAWEEETLERACRSGARAWLAKDCAEATLFAVIRTGQPPAPWELPLASGRRAAQ